jgi:hypothetical protein
MQKEGGGKIPYSWREVGRYAAV